MNGIKAKIFGFCLNWGLALLALSVTFSITLMNISFVLLLIALVIKTISGKPSFEKTGLELPVILFVGVFLISSFFAPSPVKSIKYILDKYWYILHLFIVVYLFGEKEVNRFIRIMLWSAIAISVYTLFQSFVGLTFNLNFHIGETIKMASPELEKIGSLGNHPIYLGTGVMGQQSTFGGQLLMLAFFAYGAYRKKWGAAVIFAALVLGFVYSAWSGFIAGTIAYYFKRRKFRNLAATLAAVAIIAALLAGNSNIRKDIKQTTHSLKGYAKVLARHPLSGIGAGENKNSNIDSGIKPLSSSFFLDTLMEGGIPTFAALIYLIWVFIRKYVTLPAQTKERWKRIHAGCMMGIIALLFAGLFRNYITDAENSVLFWTLAGLCVKIKQSKWKQPLFSSSDLEE